MQKEEKQEWPEMLSIEEYLIKRQKQKEREKRQTEQKSSPAVFSAGLYALIKI